MSGPLGSSQWMYSSGAASFFTETIDNSVRLVGDATPANGGRFTRTFSTVDSATDFTLNFWIKRNDLLNPVNNSYPQFIFNFRDGTSGSVLNDLCFLNPSSYGVGASLVLTETNSANYILSTNNLLRDHSAWYNIHVMGDMNNGTASERLKFFINGVEASYATDNRGSYTALTGLKAGAWTIGDYYGTAYCIGSSIARWAFVDNSTLAASYFGEFKEGIWIPKEITGITWGSAGHLLDFGQTGTSQDASGIGADTSGQGNHWAVNNIAATDILLDTPTNNFCTLNPLTAGTYPVLKEGNLSIATAYSADLCGVTSTWYPTTGKWYWEIHAEGSTLTYPYFGITDQRMTMTSATTGSYYSVAWHRAGGSAVMSGTNTYMGTITNNNVATWTNNDIIMFALDVDARKLWVGKNGTWDGSGDPAAGTGEDASWTVDTGVSPLWMGYQSQGVNSVFNFGQDGTFNGNQTAQGNADENGVGDFYYAPPTGFLAMATSNIAEPTIGPNSGVDEQSDDYFNTLLYTGTGSTGLEVNGLSFTPDFLWIKRRDTAQTFSNALVDSVRGNTKNLISNLANAESTSTGTNDVQSFDSDGFTVGPSNQVSVNDSGGTFVAWCWKAGGTAVSNTDGSITSSVSANQDAGFSIVTYTGTGSNATVGHGLSQTPEWVATKSRDSALSWYIYVPGKISADTVLAYNATNAQFSSPGAFIEGDFNATTFGVGTETPTNKSGDGFVAHCFHSVEGYSKVGSYTGNFNANGPFIYTGFRPAWLILKRTDSADSWLMRDNKRDTFNVTAQMLNANANTAEYTDSTLIDFVSNGFKLRHQNSLMNASGGTFIYLAFAEAPFKYANAR